jgi:hypothetical protein
VSVANSGNHAAIRLSNGELLKAAEESGFDILLTTDK